MCSRFLFWGTSSLFSHADVLQIPFLGHFLPLFPRRCAPVSFSGALPPSFPTPMCSRFLFWGTSSLFSHADVLQFPFLGHFLPLFPRRCAPVSFSGALPPSFPRPCAPDSFWCTSSLFS